MGMYDVNLDELQAQSDEAQKQKAYMGIAGKALNGFNQIESPAEMMLGKRSGRPDAQGMMDAAASAIPDPVTKQEKAMKMAQMLREGKQAEAADAQTARKRDPNSNESKALRMLAPRWGIQVAPDSSAYDIEQQIDPKRMMETEAKSRNDFDNKVKELEIQQRFQSGEKAKDRAQQTSLEQMKLANDVKPDQVNAATYGLRAKAADKTIQDLYNNGTYDATSLAAAAQRNSWYPEALKSEPAKMQDQAERNFVNAILRRESGAAISKDEFTNAEKQYFPRAGDTPSVLQQKAENRAVAVAGLKTAAKGAWDSVARQVQPVTVADSFPKNQVNLVPNAGAANQQPMMQGADGTMFVKGTDGKWRPL